MNPADLSDVGKPIGIFGEMKDLQSYKFTANELETFKLNGWVATQSPILTTEQVEILQKELDLFLDPNHPHPNANLFYEFHHNETGDPNNVVMHCLGHWRITPGFHDIIYHPAISVPASQLMNASVRFWHDQLFYKPPKFGGVVQWHQDYSYWIRSVPMNHLTVHIALDDQTLENGGLHYISGSHLWQRDGLPLPPAAKSTDKEWKKNLDDASFDTDMNAIKSVLNNQELKHWEQNPEVCVNLKKGCAVFHHPLAVHGSFANRTDLPRRAAVVNYFADGTMTSADGVLLKGTTEFKKGQIIESKFYPLVLDKTLLK